MTGAFRPRCGIWPIGPWALTALGVAALSATWGVGARVRLGSRDAVPPALAAKARAAERTMQAAEQLIRQAKRDAGIEPAAEVGRDPSGLLGDELTPLVTTLGVLESKRIATNPAWARILTIRLQQAGIGRTSVVAAGFSGSFPGLDLAVSSACQALGADVIAVSSVTASSWGANQAGFTWPEVEQRLVSAGLIRRVSVAISMGGRGDRALDLEPDGRRQAERIMLATARSLGAETLNPRDYPTAIGERLEMYDRARRGRPIALYVNVGGSDASLGRSRAVLRLPSGFLPGVPFDFSDGRGVMARFAERGIPVLTLLNIRDLALRWGVPLTGAPLSP
jgi:poly-gamma-glutamate system protein